MKVWWFKNEHSVEQVDPSNVPGIETPSDSSVSPGTRGL